MAEYSHAALDDLLPLTFLHASFFLPLYLAGGLLLLFLDQREQGLVFLGSSCVYTKQHYLGVNSFKQEKERLNYKKKQKERPNLKYCNRF